MQTTVKFKIEWQLVLEDCVFLNASLVHSGKLDHYHRESFDLLDLHEAQDTVHSCFVPLMRGAKRATCQKDAHLLEAARKERMVRCVEQPVSQVSGVVLLFNFAHESRKGGLRSVHRGLS